MLRFCELHNDTAVSFLKQQRASREHVTCTSSDRWMGALDDDRIVAVVGTIAIGSKIRVKSLFTDEGYRNLGIADRLIKLVISDSHNMTSFATTMSKNIFIKNGFVQKRMGNNNIAFLEREVI